ncbi:MAG: hypothetical protein IT341_10650 [Chloroflexi bacterium]|nr:hypothetical protein [Chloroflexota bacterium]
MALRAPALEQTPFTVPHFRAWASELELDNGQPWIVDDYFESFLEDYFAGIPECWLIVPEGNGKTTALGGLGVYLLEFRRGAWIPWAASSRDQAEIGYRQAEGFILRSPRLRAMFKCLEGYRRIRNKLNGNRMQIFAADDATGDGVIPSDSFIDELHRHKSLALYRTWSGKSEKRQGQLATISIAGEPYSEFELTRERIREETPVVERRPGYVHCRSKLIALHEYAVPDDSDVTDMATVKLANPSPRITQDTLAAKFATPTMTLPHWRRFRCNQATRSEASAITDAEWEAWKSDEEIPAGEPVDVGLDVAWKLDTTAAVPLWVPEPQKRLLGPATILTPPRDGSSLHPDRVKDGLRAIHERNPINVVVMDTSRAEDLAAWISDDLGVLVVDRAQQNPDHAADYDSMMAAFRNGWLHHTGDPGLSRHALNAVARELPGGRIRFDRPSSGRLAQQERRVIDALTGAGMVHRWATENLEDEPETEPWVVVR